MYCWTAGLEVYPVAKAAEWADTIMMLTPDTTQPAIYQGAVAPQMSPGKTLMFAHGFNIRYGTITPPAARSESMLTPKNDMIAEPAQVTTRSVTSNVPPPRS